MWSMKERTWWDLRRRSSEDVKGAMGRMGNWLNI